MARSCCKYFTVGLVPVTALFLALLFAFGVLSLPIIYTELAKRYEYGVVIDAGSSHTTLYVYQVDVPITGRLTELNCHNSTDSLNSFADNPERAHDVVKLLIKGATKDLEDNGVSSLHNSTHIYLGATAGMRLLKRKDKNATSAILKAASDAMHASGFKSHDGTIISGTKEAASGWLTTNYLNGTEYKHVGSLDMGGGSAEIAFSVNPKDSGGSKYYVTEKLVGNTEHLYARSYLCYGHNEARARFLAHLIHNNKDSNVSKSNVSNPCLSRGLKLNHTVAEINTTCVTDSIAVEVFGYALSLSLDSDTNSSSNITFYGTGNVAQCKEEIIKVFNFSACDPKNCDSGPFEVPPVNGPFVGFTGFSYIAEKLGIHDQTFNHSNPLMNATLERCGKLLAANSTKEYCFYGLFMAYTMEAGFGMNDSSKNWSVIFTSKAKGTTFGWALGFFMNHTYSYSNSPNHSVTPYSAVDMVVGILVLTILCAIFVVFFFLTLYACRKALKTHSGYQTIS